MARARTPRQMQRPPEGRCETVCKQTYFHIFPDPGVRSACKTERNQINQTLPDFPGGPRPAGALQKA
eukprot:12207325-Alexandrium_andersonii.AAC.1